jgi:nucleotide-binding universal stress UspA family protein
MEYNVPYRRILVPISGNADDFSVLELAGTLAEKKSAEVILVYVVEVKQSLPLDASLPDDIDGGEAALNRAEHYARNKAEHKLQKINTELLQARNAGAAIVDEAMQRDADVIVLGCRNRSHLGKVTLGETVPYILKNATCQVILSRLADGA